MNDDFLSSNEVDTHSWNTIREKDLCGELALTPPTPPDQRRTQAFDDDLGSVMDMDALRSLVASVTSSEDQDQDWDMHASYEKDELVEVVAIPEIQNVVNDVLRPLGNRTSAHPHKTIPPPSGEPSKPLNINKRKRDEESEEEDEESEEEDEESEEEDEESEEEDEAKDPFLELCAASQKFFELFVRGTFSNPPVYWTSTKVEKLATKLKIRSCIVRCHMNEDKNGELHPTPELVKKYREL